MMDYIQRQERIERFILWAIAIAFGVLFLCKWAMAEELLVLEPDGEFYYMTWDECENCDGPDKVVTYDENGKCQCTEVGESIPFSEISPNTYTLPFPDGTTWTEGQPSPWVRREEFEAFQKWVETRCFCPGNDGYLTPADVFQYNQNKGE